MPESLTQKSLLKFDTFDIWRLTKRRRSTGWRPKNVGKHSKRHLTSRQ